MKRLITIIAFLFITCSVYAQEMYIGNFKMGSHLSSVSAGYDNSNHMLVYFDLVGGSPDDDVRMIIEGERNIDNFRKQLIALQKKYTEWKDVAIKNDVTTLTKTTYIKFPNVKLGWYDTKWKFNTDHILRFNFMVYESEVSDKVIYAMIDGASLDYAHKWYLYFYNEEEMQGLIDLLDVKMLKKELSKMVNQDALFK